MWGLKKKAFKAKPKTLRYVYKGFCAVPSENTEILGAVESRNCDCRNGVLTTGFGMKYYGENGVAFSLSTAGQPVWLYVMQKKYVENENGGEYQRAISYMTDLGQTYVYNYEKKKFSLVTINYQDIAIAQYICGDKTAVTAWADKKGLRFLQVGEKFSERYVENTLPVVCAFHHRLFVAKASYTIVYNDPAKPTQFGDVLDASGSITFPSSFGEIVGLQDLGERLYVFFERAIYRLDAKGEASEFKAVRIAYDGEKILRGSIGACGEHIFFLTENGIRKFDGERSALVCEGLDIQPAIFMPICSHATHGDTFFLRYDDENKGKRTVAVESSGESGYPLFDVDGLSGCESMAFGTWHDAVGVLSKNGTLPDGECYTFTSETVTFGTEKPKTLRRLRFFGKGEFLLRTIYDGQTVEKRVNLQNGDTTVALNLRGSLFQFCFELQKNARITSMTAEVECLE